MVKKFEISGLDLTADCSIPTSQYASHKQRIQDQLLKTIEIPGFRKGKAPLDIALKSINENAFSQQVYNEVIDKFFPEIGKEIEEYLKENNRAKSDLPADIKETSIEETETELNFSFVLKLLPKIDLESFSKVKIAKSKPEELENLQSFDDVWKSEEKVVLARFNEYEKIETASKKDSQLTLDIQEMDQTNHENPKNQKKDEKVAIKLGLGLYPENFEKELVGLKAEESKEFELDMKVAHEDHSHDHHFKYAVFCHEVASPKYKNIKELVENVEEAKKSLVSVDDYKAKVQKLYDQEIELKTGQLDQQKVIKSIVKEISVPDLPINEIDSEVERIYSTLKNISEEQKNSLAEVYLQSGLPVDGKKEIKDTEVFDLIRNYVENEFKLVEMLRSVYMLKVEDKITPEEVGSIAKNYQQNPSYYNIAKNDAQNMDALKNIAYDRLIREKAFVWIKEQVKIA